MVLALKELTVQEAAADGKCNVLRSTELSHDGRACNIGTCNYTAKRERENNQINITVVHPPFLPISDAPALAEDGKARLVHLQFVPLPTTPWGVIVARLTGIHL